MKECRRRGWRSEVSFLVVTQSLLATSTRQVASIQASQAAGGMSGAASPTNLTATNMLLWLRSSCLQVKSTKMNRTIVVRRDYLHYIKKYQVRCARSSCALGSLVSNLQ